MVIILEEYGNLLKNETQELMMASLYNATVGDSYRVGGVDKDNLYPAYSNPVRIETEKPLSLIGQPGN